MRKRLLLLSDSLVGKGFADRKTVYKVLYRITVNWIRRARQKVVDMQQYSSIAEADPWAIYLH